jgi:CheY-like chemotaxis protein
VRILLVEDSLADAQLFERALERTTQLSAVTHVESGEAALNALDAHPFQMMVLDLNLPGSSGFDVLRRLRASEDEALRAMPVTVLTTTRAIADHRRAYACGANVVLTKPEDWQEFCAQISAWASFWTSTAALVGR